jgi:hypothetical protein
MGIGMIYTTMTYKIYVPHMPTAFVELSGLGVGFSGASAGTLS